MVPTAVLVFIFATVLVCQGAPVDHEKHGGSDTKCPLMVKVLDAVHGAPASALSLKVYRQAEDESWTEFKSGVTDVTGEVHDLVSEDDFISGIYKVAFDTKAYWKANGRVPFHEVADVTFQAHGEGHRHYTLALLLSPFSYTTTAVVTNAHE